MGKVIKWFSENHVAANFLMLLVLVAGFSTWFKLKKEIFPEIALDAVMVQVPYPNATAAEVEEGIILKLEEAVASVDGVKRYTSTSMESMGAMTIEVQSGYELSTVKDDIKSAIDAISELPENAEKPIIKELAITSQVMSIAVSADVDEKTLRRMAEEVRDGLLNYKAPAPKPGMETIDRMLRGEPTITKVSLANVRPYEIGIEISQDKLEQYGITLEQVASALSAASLDLPSGSIQERSGEIVIRAKSKITEANEFKKVVVKAQADGSIVTLADIGTVTDAFEDVDLRTRFNGKRAALVNVYRTGDQDTTLVSKAVNDYIQNVAPKQLPKETNLELWNDMSKMLEGRLNLLGRNGAWGLFYVFIVLALFLRPSLALLVAIGIPVSFAGGVWLMPELGVSINMISLFAFILVLGIVVDDAIVVGENIYTRIRSGEHPKIASYKGTHEVGTVVIFGIFTTMAAFTPMLGLSGVSGKIWPNIPLVVIPVLFFSLLQSKLVLPAHAALLKPRDENRKVGLFTKLQRKIADGLEWLIEHIYQPMLKRCLQYRYVVWSGFMALFLVIIGMVASSRVPFTFMPKVEGDVVSAKLEMPVGVKFDTTDKAVVRMESAAAVIGQRMRGHGGESVIKHVLTSAGTQPFKTGFSANVNSVSSHIGEVTLELIPAADRDYSSAQIIEAWRKEIGNIPGIVELTFREETSAGGNAIDIEIVGSDLAELVAASEYLTDELAKMTGVKDISTDRRLGKYEVVYTDDNITALGRSKGFTVQSIASQLRAVFAGIEIQRIQRGRDEVKVLVRYPEKDRKAMETLEQVMLTTPDGREEVPINQVVKGQPSRGFSSIHRIDGRRSISIAADVNRDVANANEVAATFTKDILGSLDEKYPGVSWGYRGEQKDQKDSITEMSNKFIFALLLIYILMAIPLKSYTQPMIVMSVIPFGMVGAVLGHMLLGMDLSIMSLCGIVALSGVVVNDSLVLVDYVNRQIAKGISVQEAVWTAGARRFRPILLTSLTTFVGLLPMLYETDMQAKFLIPMAVSLGYGILFATAITLILVPSVYVIMEDVKNLFGKIKRWVRVVLN